MIAVALLTAFTLSDARDAMLDGASRSAAATDRVVPVGLIYINGADDMSASAILNALPFQSGDSIPAARLRKAQNRLEHLGLFAVDKKTGQRPHITELPDGAFTNLRITVKLRTRP